MREFDDEGHEYDDEAPLRDESPAAAAARAAVLEVPTLEKAEAALDRIRELAGAFDARDRIWLRLRIRLTPLERLKVLLSGSIVVQSSTALSEEVLARTEAPSAEFPPPAWWPADRWAFWTRRVER